MIIQIDTVEDFLIFVSIIRHEEIDLGLLKGFAKDLTTATKALVAAEQAQEQTDGRTGT